MFERRRLLREREYRRWLLAAFNKRVTADYGIEVELSLAEVKEMLDQASEFLGVGRRFLEAHP